jgi:hypothetical protein
MKKNLIPLIEGHSYPFTITGTVELPDALEYFVLTDLNGSKHLLDKAFYFHYDLKLNMTIQCSIDRINCSGKIYIEPVHPVYKKGEVFRFPLKRFETVINSIGVEEKSAILTDIFGNEISLPSEELPQGINSGELVECRIEKIKKGRVLVSAAGINSILDDFETGKDYEFEISHIVTYGKNYDYFILIHENGKKYKLRRKFFRKYNFRTGQTIVCRIDDDQGEKFAEPVHPFYETGKRYGFQITGKTVIQSYPDEQKEAYVLKNEYGKDILIETAKVNSKNISELTIDCRVVKIIRSRLILDCT